MAFVYLEGRVSRVAVLLVPRLEQQQGLFWHPFTLSFLLIFFSFIFLLIIRLHGTKKSNLPPSLPKIPIIGNLHQLGSLAHRSLRDLSQKYGPLMLLQLGQVPTLIVSSADMAAEIMKNNDLVFANRPALAAAKALFYGCKDGCKDLAFVPYGEYWRMVRKIYVLEILSPKRVESFKLVREEEIKAVTDKITRSCTLEESVNLSEIFVTLSNDIICRCALGAKYDHKRIGDDNKLGRLSREMVGLVGAFSFGDFFPSFGWMVDVLTGFSGKLKRVCQELDTFLDQVIDQHLLPKSQDCHNQDEDKKDFIDLLLLAQNDNTNLARDNIKAIILDIFTAGSDTSATTMEWAMAELIKNPEVMKIAQDEVRRVVGKKSKVEVDDINQMEYLKCIIKESLRLHPPAPLLLPRESSKGTKIGGYDIPPSTRVFVNAWAIQRDSKLWENAEEFRPQRFINNPIGLKGQEFHFIPFGSGRRGCPGISFAVPVVELALANLLYWFDWELPYGASEDELDMTDTFGLTSNKKIPLHVVPILKYGKAPHVL